MKTNVTLRASAKCNSHSRSDVSIRDLIFSIDEPEMRGGTNKGPSPTDTALAALVGCINVIGHKCAKRHGVDIGHLAIDATCEFDRRGVTLEKEIEVPFTSVRLDVVSNGTVGEEDLAKVAADTEKFCPLSKLFLAAGTKLEIQWRKA